MGGRISKDVKGGKKSNRSASNPFVTQLRATFKGTTSNNSYLPTDDAENLTQAQDHGLTDRQRELIRLSWRCMTVDSRRMGGPGHVIFNRMIVLDPELQSVFGFNYSGPGSKIIFGGHQQAFAKMIDFIVTNLDSPACVNCKYLRDIGYKHKSTTQVGFHSCYTHIFSVSVLDTVAAALTPSSSSYCVPPETWLSTAALNHNSKEKDVEKFHFECLASWQKLVRYMRSQILYGYRSKESQMKKRTESKISIQSNRNMEQGLVCSQSNLLRTPESQKSGRSSFRKNIFKKNRQTILNSAGSTSPQSRPVISDEIFLHEKIM